MSGVNKQQAEEAIFNLIQPSEPSNKGEEANEQIEAEEEVQEEEETQEAYASDEDEQETDEDIEEGEEEEAEEGQSEDLPELYTINPNGEEIKVTLEELKSGHMRDMDYRKKTQELSAIKKAASEQAQKLDTQIEQAQMLLSLEQLDFESEEMKELREFEPEKYLEAKEKLDSKVQKLNELLSEQRTRLQSERQEQFKREEELLLQAVPEWTDHALADREGKEILDYWKSIGITDEDISSGKYMDHKLILISREAIKARSIAQSKPKTKKVISKPKSTKAASGQVSAQAKANQSDVRKKAKKTGKIQDAQLAIEELIRGK